MKIFSKMVIEKCEPHHKLRMGAEISPGWKQWLNRRERNGANSFSDRLFSGSLADGVGGLLLTLLIIMFLLRQVQ
jgi:hypothetical protein